HITLAAAIEPLFIANWLSGASLYAWKTLSRDGGPVSASNGMRLRVDTSTASDERFDATFVLASFEPKERAADASLKAWLRRQARYGSELGATETGSEILAAAGLLDGSPVAVHWDNLHGFQEAYPRGHAVSQLSAVDPNRLTCAGSTSVLDMMLHWIGARQGAELVKEIANHLLLEKVRSPEEPQLASTPQGVQVLEPA